MIRLVASDFKPLEDSVFLRRWTNLGSYVLSHPDFAQICPLNAEKAQVLWKYALVYFQELSHYIFADTSEAPVSSLFVELQAIDINHEPLEKVQRHLVPLHPHDEEVVVVMWEPTEAIAVPWPVFYSCWDDFCSPWDEEVGVMPLSEIWLLLYHHEDRLVIGKPRQPVLDQDARERAWKPPATKPLVHREEVLRLLRANEKIAAIKLYHQDTGVGLKRALDAVNILLKEID